jgi:hypothetical protein
VPLYGREEFLIILPACVLAHTTLRAEEVRLAFEASPFQIAEGTLNLTCSLGVATSSGAAGFDPAALIHEADEALYTAKTQRPQPRRDLRCLSRIDTLTGRRALVLAYGLRNPPAPCRQPCVARITWIAVLSTLLSFGCGYVGEPMPPALQIPQRVTDLSAIQQGGQIVVHFARPVRTTDNLDIRRLVHIDLNLGLTSHPFEPDSWEASGKLFSDIPSDEATVKYAVPAAEWTGKDVVIGVRVFSANGRTAGWSNLVRLSVVPPLAAPTNLQAADVREGVRLTWQGQAPHFRVYRRAAEESKAIVIGETVKPEYIDTKTEYGIPYHYSVEGFLTGGDIHAVSESTAELRITTKDTYAPPVPAGLAAVPSIASVELVWERSIASDLAGYRIYRATGGGPLEKIADTLEQPSYSDRAVESGKTYRYALAAFDKLGNESEKSTAIAVTAQ